MSGMHSIGVKSLRAAALASGLMYAMPGVAQTVTVTHNQTTNSAYAGPLYGFEQADRDGRFIRAIGIYEAALLHDGTTDATVTIADQGGRALYLILSSYESVRWHLNGAGAAAVAGVILNGYDNSFLVGQGAATIVDRSGPGYLSGAVFAYPGDAGGGDSSVDALLTFAQTQFAGEIDSFTGTYSADGFAIGLPDGTTQYGPPVDFGLPPVGGVPEPSAWATMIAGFAVVAAVLRRRRVRTTASSLA